MACSLAVCVLTEKITYDMIRASQVQTVNCNMKTKITANNEYSFKKGHLRVYDLRL